MGIDRPTIKKKKTDHVTISRAFHAAYPRDKNE
jgi:hypothetical protein